MEQHGKEDDKHNQIAVRRYTSGKRISQQSRNGHPNAVPNDRNEYRYTVSSGNV